MKRTAVFLGLCLLGFTGAARAADKPAELILGKWVPADEDSKRSWDFAKDGSVVITEKGAPGAVRGKYRLTADDKMQVAYRIDNTALQLDFTFNVTKNELVVTD